ncbi:MAG: ABC transporter ATP-binding protein [Butyrivibrio sp.]|nr:ABC transporter ATP-binding protein [Butyrivibrio sp.]
MAENTEMNILHISGLTASYEEAEVLHDVTLEVEDGEILCIVGESGCGKSTLIRAICADPVLRITGGSIRYREQDITHLKERDRQRLLGTQIGLIQQNPWGAFNPIRPIGVQFRETYKSHGRRFDADQIRAIFDVLGLKNADSILQMRPCELSGGMSQRVAIAAAFALEPALLLCDEITSALDVTTAAAVTEQLLTLKRTQGTTIVMVTHHIGMARCLADRIAIMYRGRIVECGSTAEILASPQHDYTKQLLQDVPRLRVE